MILEALTTFATSIITTIGYSGIFILMALESTVFPIPSETVMPFAGFLINEGRFTFLGVALASSLGSVTGSLVSYYLGKKGGVPLLKRYGKYLFLNEEHLSWTEVWFNKHGQKTIFISRFLPIVRHFISIPAGVGNMKLTPFLLYTFLGAALWNSFLAYLGIILNTNWELVRAYSTFIDVLFVILIVFILAAYLYLHFKRRANAPHF
ncbi:MAG TPA: DedA family protein [Candidatus Nanoarchaeia archaeon]|nr:DedA family protein [Candidatus Nanoarchaeia archaeon]